ncbi:MAG: AAA family ATPase, partial [Atribacterota bacterium]|nr:AAA family ATPase [Atribacterota bacterium]
KIFKKVPIEGRVKSAIQYVLSDNLYKNSNLCVPYSILQKDILGLFEKCDQNNNVKGNKEEYLKTVQKCLREYIDEFTAVRDNEKNVFIYLKNIWYEEKYIAERIYNLHKEKNYFNCSDDDIKWSEESISKFYDKKINLDDCQKRAIKSSFENKITVITGAGGTGKSSICKCIYDLCKKNGLSIRLMSPTGKASQVLSEKTGGSAATIHRSLGMKPGDNEPEHKISEDIVIIDEVSMLGIDTMYAIMIALSNNLSANLVLVGDANQLPSVSPGNFLSDIINSKCANVVVLDKIHRQDEKSYISLLANEISKGKIVDIPEDAIDIKWNEIESDEKFYETIKSSISKYNMDDLQIIAPMYRGNFGINKINQIVQEMMVKEQENHVIINGNRFNCGDRVIQTENNYEKLVFNGDIGKIIECGRKVIDKNVSDKEQTYMIVDFFGQIINYVENEIEQLRLAWCISVHKFQGSQSPNIFFIMSKESQIMMSKEIVYTGFTRASKNLTLFGHLDMLKIAPVRSMIRKRYTNLCKLIQEKRDNKKIFEVLGENK